MYQISLTKEQLQILYEMVLEGKSMEPSEIMVFSDKQLAQACYLIHYNSSYQRGIDERNVYH